MLVALRLVCAVGESYRYGETTVTAKCGDALFTAKKKSLTKAVATELLKNGKVKLTGCYSEKTGKPMMSWLSSMIQAANM